MNATPDLDVRITFGLMTQDVGHKQVAVQQLLDTLDPHLSYAKKVVLNLFVSTITALYIYIYIQKSICYQQIHILGLNLQGATDRCRAFGSEWGVNKETDGSVVCTKSGTAWNSNCNACDTWRLVVWNNGANEYGNAAYSTIAGKYYAGHSPCVSGDNLPVCGTWLQLISWVL